MSNTIRSLSMAALAAMATSVCSAQESLMDIYQRAVQNDPAIRQAEASYQANLQNRPQARSALLPQLQLSAGIQSSRTEDPNRPTDFITGRPSEDILSTENESDADQWQVSLNQTVFDWGRIVSLKQADKAVAQAEAEYELAKQDLLLRVSGAYFDVLGAEDTLAAQVAAREALARQLEQAQRRFDVGLIAITDVQQAQAGYDNAVAQEIEAQRALATFQEFLREIIGEYVIDLSRPSDDLPLQTPDPADADEWVETALQQNLALISSRIAAEIQEDNIQIQRANRLPTVNLQAGWSDQTRDNLRILNCAPGADPFRCSQSPPTVSASEGYNWSLNFNIPLYTGGLNRSRIQQSVYQHRAAIETLELIARQTERATRDAYLGVISGISSVRALQQAVESSRTALRATEAGFEVGTQTTVDVLIAQDNLRQSETAYARSRYNYILNVLRLKQAAGTLAVNDLEEVNGWLE